MFTDHSVCIARDSIRIIGYLISLGNPLIASKRACIYQSLLLRYHGNEPRYSLSSNCEVSQENEKRNYPTALEEILIVHQFVVDSRDILRYPPPGMTLAKY